MRNDDLLELTGGRKASANRVALLRRNDAQLFIASGLVTAPIQGVPRRRNNEACPCGSGKKYKRCCRAKETSHPPHYTFKTH